MPSCKSLPITFLCDPQLDALLDELERLEHTATRRGCWAMGLAILVGAVALALGSQGLGVVAGSLGAYGLHQLITGARAGARIAEVVVAALGPS
ncbi:MAG: hypothetical protein JWM80_6180 [Cyanobacteria bacterium RYN_339]|nr:hypothetical protein [Cyanobacteria bacterium RYN_339]